MEHVAIVGTCRDMCPEAEIRERERAGLVHFFERADVQPTATVEHHFRGRGSRQQNQRTFRESIRADKRKAVKSYSRPAAGVDKTAPSDLRPVPVLKKTVAYLCTEILLRTDRPFVDVYDFIFDRLRAVRQDMVIQRISDENAIVLLESIVKFHLYAEYKFRSDAPSNYDPFINQKHLRDCLKTLLSFYGINNYYGHSRPFFEALYCLNSPESYEVISRAFKIKTDFQDDHVFLDSLEICLAIQHKNFYKFFKLLNELPPLLAGFCVQQVPFMRKHALRAISVAYGVQNCKIPLVWLEELLCYSNEVRTAKEMLRIGCDIITRDDSKEDKFVKFSKTCKLMKSDLGIELDPDVKFTVLNGLNNVEVIATEQICPWSRQLV